MLAPRFFATPAAFRAWLDAHHASARELIVGFYRKGTGKPSITWPESVDEALCYGWIDGVRRTLDAESYSIRFTPRQPTSVWSNVNIAKVEALTKAGRMMLAGVAAYSRRDPAKSGIYSFERETARLDPAMERTLKRSRPGWAFFQMQPPGYRKLAVYYVVSAKRPETRAKRLATLIAHSARGERLPGFVSAKRR